MPKTNKDKDSWKENYIKEFNNIDYFILVTIPLTLASFSLFIVQILNKINKDLLLFIHESYSPESTAKFHLSPKR